MNKALAWKQNGEAKHETLQEHLAQV